MKNVICLSLILLGITLSYLIKDVAPLFLAIGFAIRCAVKRKVYKHEARYFAN